MFAGVCSGTRRSRAGAVSVLCAGLLLGISSCRRAPELATQPAPPEGEPVPLNLKTPEDAARTVLSCLKAIRQASLRGDQRAAAWYREQLRPMAARDVIQQRFHAVRPDSSEDFDVVLDRFLQGWSAILAYYLDGLQLDRVTAGAATSATQVDVHVPAASDRGKAMIRLECFRGPDKLWRVARIDFGSARTAATATATTAATGPSP